MDLATLIQGLDIRHAGGPAPAGVRISDLTEDSRTAVTGSLFVARRGVATNGNRFVDDARRLGAVAVLSDDAALAGDPRGVCVLVSNAVAFDAAVIAERFYGEPSAALKLIGVTGTNGKSTVAHIAHRLLNHAGKRCGLIGTIEIDDGRETAPAVMTTPPACEVSRTLATMREHGCGWCAMEASSHALDQGRVAGVRFDAAVFTNLTGDHQDYHKTMEAYADAKRRLFGLLDPGGVAVMNADDPAWERMASAHKGGVLRCRMDDPEACEAWVDVVDEGPAGLELVLHGPFGEVEITLGLHGRHNAMNALQAAVAAHSVGLPAEAIKPGLASIAAPQGRLEPVEIHAPGAKLPRVFVDFAHTDDALRAALEAARPIAGESGQLWVVFGCGGEKDTSKRPRMGGIAAQLADRIVLTSDNPRRESPGVIIDEVLLGIPERERSRVEVQARRERAILAAIRGARPDDVIVLAGKGHETTQELANPDGSLLVVPFDDRAHARSALEARSRGSRVAEPA